MPSLRELFAWKKRSPGPSNESKTESEAEDDNQNQSQSRFPNIRHAPFTLNPLPHHGSRNSLNSASSMTTMQDRSPRSVRPDSLVFCQDMYKLAYGSKTNPHPANWGLKRVKVTLDEVPQLVYRTKNRDRRSVGPKKRIDLSQVTRIGRCHPNFTGNSGRNKYGIIEIVTPERTWIFAPYIPKYDATTGADVARELDGSLFASRYESFTGHAPVSDVTRLMKDQAYREYASERERFILKCADLMPNGRSIVPDKQGGLNVLVQLRATRATWQQRFFLAGNGWLFEFKSRDRCKTFISSLYFSPMEFEAAMKNLVLQHYDLKKMSIESVDGKFYDKHRFVFRLTERDGDGEIYLQATHSAQVDDWINVCEAHGATRLKGHPFSTLAALREQRGLDLLSSDSNARTTRISVSFATDDGDVMSPSSTFRIANHRTARTAMMEALHEGEESSTHVQVEESSTISEKSTRIHLPLGLAKELQDDPDDEGDDEDIDVEQWTDKVFAMHGESNSKHVSWANDRSRDTLRGLTTEELDEEKLREGDLDFDLGSVVERSESVDDQREDDGYDVEDGEFDVLPTKQDGSRSRSSYTPQDLVQTPNRSKRSSVSSLPSQSVFLMNIPHSARYSSCLQSLQRSVDKSFNNPESTIGIDVKLFWGPNRTGLEVQFVLNREVSEVQDVVAFNNAFQDLFVGGKQTSVDETASDAKSQQSADLRKGEMVSGVRGHYLDLRDILTLQEKYTRYLLEGEYRDELDSCAVGKLFCGVFVCVLDGIQPLLHPTEFAPIFVPDPKFFSHISVRFPTFEQPSIPKSDTHMHFLQIAAAINVSCSGRLMEEEIVTFCANLTGKSQSIDEDGGFDFASSPLVRLCANKPINFVALVFEALQDGGFYDYSAFKYAVHTSRLQMQAERLHLMSQHTDSSVSSAGSRAFPRSSGSLLDGPSDTDTLLKQFEFEANPLPSSYGMKVEIDGQHSPRRTPHHTPQPISVMSSSVQAL